jgi:hypothetical protein
MIGLAALIVTVTMTSKQIEASFNNLRSSAVMGSRQAWINDLRMRLAALISTLHTLPHATAAGKIGAAETNTKFDEFVVNKQVVLLLLNPTEKDHQDLASKLKGAEDLLIEVINKPSAESAPIQRLVDDLTRSSQKILKREWERVKSGDSSLSASNDMGFK